MMNHKKLPDMFLRTASGRILSFLTLHPDQAHYDKEISELAGVSRGATNQVLNDFHRAGLISREKRGKMWFYRMQSTPVARAFRRFENLIVLTELAQLLAASCKRVVLFGSAADGTDTAESDIDLFAISNRPEEALSAIRVFASDRPIRPVVQTPAEYAASRAGDSAFYEQVGRGTVLVEREPDEERL